MTSGEKNKLILIGIVTFIAIIILIPTVMRVMGGAGLPSWWPSEPIKLGLDLRGGTYFVYRVQTEEAVKSRLNALASQLRRELRREKAAVIRVRQVGARGVEVNLLGDSGLEKLREVVAGNYSQLKETEVKEEGRNTRVRLELGEERAKQIAFDSVDNAIETIRNRVNQFGVAEATILRRGHDQVIVQLPDIKDVERVKKTIGKVAKLDFMLVSQPGANMPSKRYSRRQGGEVQLEEEILMSGDAIDTAQADINPMTNELEVVLRLNALGARTFDSITAENVGRRLAIVLDGVVQSDPNIRERISGGTASITGGFSPQEARELAIVLRSGALPAPLQAIEERTVGATLGEDSISKGIYSMLVGSLLVVAFVIVYYRKAGMLAVGCLVLNLVLLLSLLALIGATLTLPGIAGLILTVGMSVDANVIIFERIREELRAGSTARAAMEGGFAKAHWTILDANITTLLTGIILYSFGSGPIKGFAVTLSFGILTSLFTALYVARAGFEVLELKDKNNSISI